MTTIVRSRDRNALQSLFLERAVALAFLSAVALLGPAPDLAAQDDRPVVKIFATGGTIANTPDGRIAVSAIIDALPEVEAMANLRIEDITRKGSSSLTWQEFVDTAKAIQRSLGEEPEIDGVMVTIGSNAAEDMAYFLNLTIDTEKPIVVTAAQRRRSTRSEDASRNFIDALITATTPEAGGKGVLLVANELIHPAREVTKNVFARVDTWESLDTGALGIISAGEAVFYRAPTRAHTAQSAFSIADIETAADMPAVEILYSYVDASPALISAAIEDAGAKGLVIASFPTGSAHRGQREPLETAAQAGIPVVLSSRGSAGRVAARPEPYITGDNLTPQKALILLKLALTRTSDSAEIQQVFDTH